MLETFTYSLSRILLIILEYVDGLPIPFFSKYLIKPASISQWGFIIFFTNIYFFKFNI